MNKNGTKKLVYKCWNCGAIRAIEVPEEVEVDPEETISCKKCIRNIKLFEVK